MGWVLINFAGKASHLQLISVHDCIKVHRHIWSVLCRWAGVENVTSDDVIMINWLWHHHLHWGVEESRVIFFFDQGHLITISSGFLKISANFCKVWTLSCLCETLANGCDLSSWPYTLDPQQILPSPHTIPHRRTYARLFFWLLSPQLLLSYVKTPPSITPNVRATLNPGHRSFLRW